MLDGRDAEPGQAGEEFDTADLIMDWFQLVREVSDHGALIAMHTSREVMLHWQLLSGSAAALCLLPLKAAVRTTLHGPAMAGSGMANPGEPAGQPAPGSD